MSKERLEEIQKEVNYAYRRDGSISTKAVTMPIEHYEHLYEQSERVQELEKELVYYKMATESYIDVEQQNKRYREALEFYADIRNHNERRGERVFGDVFYDEGKIAREALEEMADD